MSSKFNTVLVFSYCRIDNCFCSPDTESCSIFYQYIGTNGKTQRDRTYKQVVDANFTKIEPPSQPAEGHGFVCREPGDEDVLLCERWNMSIPVCAESFSVCRHRWEFSTCTSHHSIKLCKLESNKNSARIQSVIDTCRYGFQTSAPPSESTAILTTEMLTTSETSYTREMENYEETTFDGIPVAVLILLCYNLVLTVVIILALVLCQKQDMKNQGKDVSPIEPEECIVIENCVYGYSYSPPSTSGRDLPVCETGNKGKIAQEAERVHRRGENSGEDPQGLNVQSYHDEAVSAEYKKRDFEKKKTP